MDHEGYRVRALVCVRGAGMQGVQQLARESESFGGCGLLQERKAHGASLVPVRTNTPPTPQAHTAQEWNSLSARASTTDSYSPHTQT